MDKAIARNNTLYQIFDLKAGSIAGPIIIEKRDGPAIRSFHDLLRDERSTISRHPDDYELRVVGVQDEDTGHITGCLPYTIATGTSWVEMQQPRAEQLQLAQA